MTREEVEELLRRPEQLVPGVGDTFIAQMRRGNGLLRAPFSEAEGRRTVLTVYWTSRVERYWKE